LRRILIAGAAVWIAYQVLGRTLLSFLLGTGAMPPNDLERLLDCISWMLCSAPAMAAIPYLFRLQYTLNDYRWPAYIGGAVPLVYGATSSLLLPRLGLLALPLALAVAWWLALGGAMLALRKNRGSSPSSSPDGPPPT
ncbi:MAG: lipid II flippase MurJ, partial [Rubrivivax sp.]